LIVRCENCQSEFSLEDAQVPPEGMTVRCSVCAYVFKVESAGAPAETGWQIRTTDDMLFTSPDVETMVRWIEEGRLHPDDQVSRTGRNWLRIGDMAEFAHLFEQDDSVPVFTPVGGPSPAERSAEAELGPPPSFGGGRDAAETAPVVRGESGLLNIGGMEAAAAAAPAPAPAPPAAAPAGLLQSGPVTRSTVPPAEQSTAAASTVAGGLAEASNPPPASVTQSRPIAPPPSLSQASPAPSPEKSSSAGPVIAAIAAVSLVAGVAIFYPPVRNMIMGGGAAVEQPAPPAADTKAPVAKSDEGGEQAGGDLNKLAETALASLGAKSVSEAEAAIQRAVDSGEIAEDEFPQMRLVQAELLSSRGLAYKMAAAASKDDDAKKDFEAKAKSDLDHASRILDGLGASAPKGPQMQSIRAQVRLLDGSDADAVEGLLPKDGADSAHLLVKGSNVWRDAKPRVKRKLIRDLEDLEEPSGLERSLLALALMRSDDPEGAREIAKHLEAGAEDSPVAQAILDALGRGEDGGEESTDTGEAPAADEGAEETTGEPPAVAVADTPKKKKKPSGGGGGGGGGGGLDALITRGCGQVQSGKYSAGVKTMLKAFDRAPGDLDVMVCLAQGYEGMGQASSALTFYDRVLKKSPSHRVALRKAAALYAKRGSKAKALKLYEKLLKVEPGNSAAKAYVEANKEKPAPAPSPAPTGSGGTTPSTPSAPTPQPKPTPAPSGGSTPPAGGPSGGASPTPGG
jgi:predicted Zn finger-like uncharacterized protein